MKRILVVDDSRFTCSEIKSIIPQDSYEVIGHAMSGEEAIQMYEELQPDIVTMDIIMPGIDGIEAASEIISLDKNASDKIILLSSLCDTDTIEEIHSLGIKHFVPKPIEKDVLLYAMGKISK